MVILLWVYVYGWQVVEVLRWEMGEWVMVVCICIHVDMLSCTVCAVSVCALCVL